MIPLVLLCLLTAINLGLLVLALRKLNQYQGAKNFEEILNKTALDLAERIVKASSETKMALASGISQEFSNTWEKLSQELGRSRQDQENRLKETAVSLEKRLDEIHQRVDEKLLAIG